MERESFIISAGYHRENVLMVVLEGSFELILNGNRFVAQENSVVYFRKGEYFKRQIIEPIRIIYIIPDVDCRLSSGLLEFEDGDRKNSSIRFLIDAINLGNTQNVRHFSSDLITQYLLEKQLKNSTYSKETQGFFEFIDKNHSEKLKIEDYLGSIYMSHAGFLLKFKKETGITPREYISNFRLEKSIDLLINTTFSIGKIAEECGYENLYYFSNAFKKKYGLSPGNFRKNNL